MWVVITQFPWFKKLVSFYPIEADGLEKGSESWFLKRYNRDTKEVGIMFPNLGWGELLVILAIGLLLFGAKRLPDLAQSLGKAIKIFKQSLKGDSSDEEDKKS